MPANPASAASGMVCLVSVYAPPVNSDIYFILHDGIGERAGGGGGAWVGRCGGEWWCSARLCGVWADTFGWRRLSP